MIFLDDDNTNSEIFIPPVACNFRNNCQDGNWQFDSEVIAGDGAEFMFFAYSPWFGDLGSCHQNKNWGQVWGYPLIESAPPLVFVTYLKTSGHTSFCNQWNKIKSQGKNPSRFLWRSRFVKETCVTPQGPGKYYLLLWEVEELAGERFDFAELVEKEMRANIARLADPQGTANMILLLGKTEEEKQAAIASFKAAKNQQLAPATPF